MLLEVEDNLVIESLDVKFAKEMFDVVDKNRLRLKKFLGWLDNIKTANDEEDYIKGLNKEIITNFVIKFDNAVVGTVDFHDYNVNEKSADIGYWIDIDFEGKGIITKCCKRLIKYGFDELGLKNIIIHCDVQNIKSENVAKKLDFDFVKIVKNHCNLYGVWSDSKEYLLTKDKYNAAIAQ